MSHTNQRMWAASGPSSRRFNLNEDRRSPPRQETFRPRLLGHLPRAVRGGDEEVDDHPVAHVEALLNGPAAQTDASAPARHLRGGWGAGAAPDLMWLFFQVTMWNTVETRKRAHRPKPYTQAVILSQLVSDRRCSSVMPMNAGTMTSCGAEGGACQSTLLTSSDAPGFQQNPRNL